MSEPTKAGPETPPEARSNAELNAGPPPDQREPVGKLTKKQLDDGPDVGENGEYRPAAYELASGNIRVDR